MDLRLRCIFFYKDLMTNYYIDNYDKVFLTNSESLNIIDLRDMIIKITSENNKVIKISNIIYI